MNELDLHSAVGASIALLPEFFLAAWSLLMLLVTAWRHETEKHSRFVGWLAVVGVLIAGGLVIWLWLEASAPGIPHMVALDGFRFASSGIVLLSAGATALLSLRFMGRQRLLAPEYYVLIIFALIGMLLMCAAADLILIFLGLEVMSVAIYVLAGYDRYRRSSAEAALKYFLIGAFASAFLLYGIALIYGATGQTNLLLIGAALEGQPHSVMANAGLALLLVGLGFKIAAVPFHMWAPDVYDGAPTPITGFMASGVKAAGFIALVRILDQAFPSEIELWRPVIAGLAIATMLLGNIVALAQQSLKRMLAYSSIAHAGYLLVGVWTGTPLGAAAVLIYLAAYCLTTVAAFGILTAVEYVGSRTILIEDMEGLFSVRPWGALSMSVCLLSLLGFPGTFGFIGKWYLTTAALSAGEIVLPIVVMLTSAISIYYYLSVLMAMCLKASRSKDSHRQVLFSRAGKVIIATAVIANIVFGLWPSELLKTALTSGRTVVVETSDRP